MVTIEGGEFGGRLTGVRVRGYVGCVCHGRPRGPQEPHGLLAPLARAVAWALMAGAGCLLILVPVVYHATGSADVAGRTLGAAGLAAMVSVVLRLLATGMRPTPVTLRMADPGS